MGQKNQKKTNTSKNQGNQNKNTSQRQSTQDGGISIRKFNAYLAFIEWAATPTPEREYRTMSEFAEGWNINRTTLYKWKREKEFWQQVEDHRIKKYRERTSTVMQALYNRILKYGMAADVELWLAYFEGWDKKQVAKDAPKRFAEDDIRELISRLPEEKQKQYYDMLAQLLSDVSIAERNQ